MSNKNDHDIYIIPPNFIETGTFFGGMFRARNVIEAGILAFAIGTPVFLCLPFGLTGGIALTIGQNLENDRDVLKILTSYRRVAGKDFGAELDQTIADMKTGNYENALIHFETRIGSPMLSDVIRGLIGVLRGDDQRMYFKMICFDMRQIEQNNLKKEAAKRPKKIQRYSMMMLICIMIIYLVVLCTEVMGSLGAFFG